MKGMTAFAKAKKRTELYEVSVEISSVNRRHAEIVFKMPPGYQELESILRKHLSSLVARGQVSVSVAIQALSAEEYVSAINIPYIEAQFSCAREIAKLLHTEVQEKEIALELWKTFLTEQKRGEREIELVAPVALEAMRDAYQSFDERRKAEGVSLKKDFLSRLQTLQSSHREIAAASSSIAEDIRIKITTALQNFVSESLASDERVLREVVLLADKADVSEELTRIAHHLDHMEKVLHDDSAPVGKLLEFLLQELLREFNTLGAKTTKPSVSTATVLAKLELEKMREQVLNVE
jgi:uncharacterized protein (TIGR00255 family)